MEEIFCTPETLKATLARHGVAAIKNTLTAEECAALVSGLAEAMEKLTERLPTPFDSKSPETYKVLSQTLPLHQMIYQHSGVGWCKAAVDVRQNPKVVANFRALHGTDDLWTSYDGVAVSYPYARRQLTAPKKTWFHIDSDPQKNETDIVQSWVTGVDVNPGDATLTVLAGAAEHWKEYCRVFAAGVDKRIDWHQLSAEEMEFFESRGCKRLAITCPAGTHVFWNSCTPHEGTPPQQPCENRSIRAVVYACMTPRTFAARQYTKGKLTINNKKIERTKKQRFEWAKAGRNTSHSPCNPRVFGTKPYNYGGPLPDLVTLAGESNFEERKSWMTPLGLKVFGLD